jgi:plasmid replication initiation protein
MLQKDRHPNRDFFVADLTTWAVKDDRTSMEHPFFSLSKSHDTTVRHYEHHGKTITIAPSAHGMPTIWDKDILTRLLYFAIAGVHVILSGPLPPPA